MTTHTASELIDQIPCGRAMDALIAYSFWRWDMDRDFDTHTGGLLFVVADSYFSTNLHNALELLGKLPRQFQLFGPMSYDGLWVAKFVDQKTGLHYNGFGETIALALCRAALKRLFSLDLTGATDKHTLGRILDDLRGAK